MEKEKYFKTAAGLLGYHSGIQDPNDPPMTKEEWEQWQKGVIEDCLEPFKQALNQQTLQKTLQKKKIDDAMAGLSRACNRQSKV